MRAGIRSHLLVRRARSIGKRFMDYVLNSNISLNCYYSKGYEQYDNIYALISAYGKSLNNKEQGKNLIHKLLLENRLKIIAID